MTYKADVEILQGTLDLMITALELTTRQNAVAIDLLTDGFQSLAVQLVELTAQKMSLQMRVLALEKAQSQPMHDYLECSGSNCHRPPPNS